MAGIAALHRADGIGSARNRGLGNIGGVGIADGVVLHRAQAEPLSGVIVRLFETAIVKQQHFRLAVFEEQLAVVCAFKAARQDFHNVRLVEPGAVDK